MAYTYFKVTKKSVESIRYHFESSLHKFKANMEEIEREFNRKIESEYSAWNSFGRYIEYEGYSEIISQSLREIQETKDSFKNWIDYLKDTYNQYKDNCNKLMRQLETKLIRLSPSTAISIDCDHAYYSNHDKGAFYYKMPNGNMFLLENTTIRDTFDEYYPCITAFPDSESFDFDYEYREFDLRFYYDLNTYFPPYIEAEYYDENQKKISR